MGDNKKGYIVWILEDHGFRQVLLRISPQDWCMADRSSSNHWIKHRPLQTRIIWGAFILWVQPACCVYLVLHVPTDDAEQEVRHTVLQGGRLRLLCGGIDYPADPVHTHGHIRCGIRHY